jgi:hypothetical protein
LKRPSPLAADPGWKGRDRAQPPNLTRPPAAAAAFRRRIQADSFSRRRHDGGSRDYFGRSGLARR